MRLRVLGARQGESRDSHFGSLLLDDALVLDAGGLTASLTLDEQARLRGVLLTHHHYDHIKDLATLGFNLFVAGRQVDVYCTDEVRARAEATILSDLVWIDFFARPSPDAPTFVHHPVEPERAFSLAGYRIRPIPVLHSVPALGYEVGRGVGETFLYSGDSGPGSGRAWATAEPALLIVEVTYPDAQSASAAEHGHLSASLLAEELRVFRAARGYLPRVLVVHVNPYYEREIAAEVAALAGGLAADVRVAREGETIEVGPPS